MNELGRGRYLRLVEQGGYEYVERIKGRLVVGILAVTLDKNILLVEQHRPAVNAPVIALPAGLVGDDAGHESEDPATAARRELIEETGYDAERFEPLLEGSSAPGLSADRVLLYRAVRPFKVAAGGGIEGENIDVYEVPLAEIDVWLRGKMRDGVVVDMKLYTGLYFAQQTESATS